MDIRLVITVALLAAVPGHASTLAVTKVLTPVQRLVVAINNAEARVPTGIFTSDAVVIDEFPPFHWSGKTSGTSWYGDLVGITPAKRAAFVASHARVSFGAPDSVKIEATTAYVVVPGRFEFDEDGARVTQSSRWTFALVRRKVGWLIAGHAWGLTGEVRIPLHSSAPKGNQ